MRLFLSVFNVPTTYAFIALLTTTLFRCASGFYPLAPIDVYLPIDLHKKEYSHAQLEVDRETNFFEQIMEHPTISFMIFCRKPMPSIINTMIDITFHISFRWEIRYGCICRKSIL
jgi:hypothetical protein